ncbi:MAG TPA: glycoside hydrolase family 140 protein [Balneolales bacterium]|nr:glycoside hydrolase family 140 protein [Balneolales bacterium]
MKHRLLLLVFFSFISIIATQPGYSQSASNTQGPHTKPWSHGQLEVSANGRFLQHTDGTPFFWLGDTAWLMFQRLNRKQVREYLDDRASKGFNVIQCMVLHELPEHDTYGSKATINSDPARPLTTPGNDPGDPKQYDYWDNIDYCIHEAAKRGIYVALVPVWGSIVKSGQFDEAHAEKYARFLANRFKNDPNIIWINGGDTKGSVKTKIWNTIGKTIKRIDHHHLMTFHPYGRTCSSQWFHDASWLDFDMFQSGHRDYSQIGNDNPTAWKGEDNWHYVREDRKRKPLKPVMDGEPSYEGIPHGLHNPSEPRWKAYDARRYAWWSVLAGACGHTYGDNAVIQFYEPPYKPAYGAYEFWWFAIHDRGSSQIRYVKKLMLSRPYFQRRYDEAAIVGNPGTRHDRVIAAKGRQYEYAYIATGRPFSIKLGRITGKNVKAWWYNPRTGKATLIGTFANHGTHHFNPPGAQAEGNDWVLVLDDSAAEFSPPGILKH